MIEWRDIKNYEGYYKVNNIGEIASVDRVDCRGQHRKGIIKKQVIHHSGYAMTQLCKDRKDKNVYIHRLVAEAFLPNPDNLPCVNHKDECKINNFVYLNDDGTVDYDKSNLEFCTIKYNSTYGTCIERQIKNNPKRYEVIQLSLNGDVIKEYFSCNQAERETGVNHQAISECVNGKRKTAGGYIWIKKSYQQ